MATAPNGHRLDIVYYKAMQDQPRAEYTANCADCHWMGLSRSTREHAEQDVGSHSCDSQGSGAVGR